MGSSPRTWGCFCRHIVLYPLVSVFPTHVGVFLVREETPQGSPRLPHARGGVSGLQARASSDLASSPRTWGCFPHLVKTVLLCNVFPTHVGVFLRRLIAVMISGSLPHARGGVSGIHDAPYQRGHSFCLHHVRGGVSCEGSTSIGVLESSLHMWDLAISGILVLE